MNKKGLDVTPKFSPGSNSGPPPMQRNSSNRIWRADRFDWFCFFGFLLERKKNREFFFFFFILPLQNLHLGDRGLDPSISVSITLLSLMVQYVCTYCIYSTFSICVSLSLSNTENCTYKVSQYVETALSNLFRNICVAYKYFFRRCAKYLCSIA